MPVGGRKISHLKANINALTHDLTTSQVETLEAVYPFEYGFPYDRFGRNSHETGRTENWLVGATARMQWVKAEQAIRPSAE
jgi:hypothetical protein